MADIYQSQSAACRCSVISKGLNTYWTWADSFNVETPKPEKGIYKIHFIMQCFTKRGLKHITFLKFVGYFTFSLYFFLFIIIFTITFTWCFSLLSTEWLKLWD